jgi:SAM-dependent methyltransferase
MQDEWMEERRKNKTSVRRNILVNYAGLALLVLLKRMNLWETVVTTGLKRRWFDEFLDYWRNVLGGARIGIAGFHQLRFHYRQCVHARNYDKQFSWNDEAEHLRNWQATDNIYLLFNGVAGCAVTPFRSRHLPRLLKRGARVLEYGCSMAPMYRTYREYLSHIPAQWVLADIPNLPFHYARHTYARDSEVEQFVTITEALFDDPLRNVEGDFDLIIVQTVFEHLHKPRHIAEYLVNRLRGGGHLLFDYIESNGMALDTPSGVQERAATLEYLFDNLEVV